MTPMQKRAYKWFKKIVSNRVDDNLKKSLQSAGMGIRGDVYLAWLILLAIIGLITTGVIVVVLFLFIFPILNPPFILTILFAISPFIISGLIVVGGIELPNSRAKLRGRRIDLNLPYAINYVSAMSSAGVTPTEIFHSLSKQEIYGEIQKEAASIYKDVSILGKDILSAIRDAVKRTPSEKFGEFLQGLIVTVTSGGSLKTYFVAKAKQYMIENRQQQRQMIENLGIMAESYVTAAVAGILLMFIVIPVMMIISGDPGQLNFLYIIIFPIVPMIHTGFAYVIRSMTLGV